MRGQRLLSLGALLVVGGVGCGNNDPAPGSTIMMMTGGNGGDGGAAGNALDLGLGAGKGGGGMGGTGGGGAGGTGTAGSNAQGGTLSMAGASNQAGSSSVGGSKASGTCARAPSSDGDCIEFDLGSTQAWSCTDRSAFRTLDDMHGNKCINGNIVPGAAVSGCCPP